MIIVLGLFQTMVDAQVLRPKTICKLPKEIRESSGLVVLNDSIFITHNDGGNLPQLFQLKSDGIFTLQIFSSLKNHDWEEACMMNNELLIGDFGNNCNCRNNLSVLRFKMLMDSSGKILFQPDGDCHFHFSDQKNFPPSKSNFNFDCEAMCVVNGELFLFSKNMSMPSDGFTKIYRLNPFTDSTEALLVDSMYLNAPVTGACSIANTDSVLLMSYFGLFECNVNNQDHFSLYKSFTWNHFSQKEAIAVSENQIYLTDEKHFGGKLYHLSIDQLNKNSHSKKILHHSFRLIIQHLKFYAAKRLMHI